MPQHETDDHSQPPADDRVSNLEFENTLLRKEVASLNEEMVSVVQRAKEAERSKYMNLQNNLRSGILFSEEHERKATRDSAVSRGQSGVSQVRKKHEWSAASPESGLLSEWSKKKRVFEAHSNNWLHDCMFDFQCNIKTM